jgi:hypothetical protein
MQAADDAASAALGLVCCGGIVVVPIFWFVLNVAILFWVAKDARSRGIDGAMWLLLIFFFGFLGLAIYLYSRPQGSLARCGNCGNNRLSAAVHCPHCGADRPRRRSRRRRAEEEADRPDETDDPISIEPQPRQVVACPSCGARLRLPERAAGANQKFLCSNCMKPVDVDASP